MAKMADSAAASLEYRALVTCTDKMISVISSDPLTVAAKLVAKELLPPASLSPALLQSKENEVKASEIVQAVSNKVKVFPECFETFVAVLDEAPWLQSLVKSIRDQYKKLKEELQETMKEQNPHLPSKPKELNLKNALFAVKDVAARWRFLGLSLEVKNSILEAIQADNPDVTSRLSAMLDYWLKGNAGKCSWKFLCEALRSIERPDLAKDIEKEHNIVVEQ